MKVLLDLSSYPTKKELKDATGVDTSNLVAEIDFIVLNAEVDKLDHRELKTIASGLNNVYNKGDDSDYNEFTSALNGKAIKKLRKKFLIKINKIDCYS